jgi:hypothetical protein
VVDDVSARASQYRPRAGGAASLALLLAVPLPALAASPYEGRWAEQAAWCSRTRADGDESPIRITARAVEQFASSCAVQSVRRKAGTWTLQTLCRDEGEDANAKRTPNSFVLRVDGDQLYMRDIAGIRNFTRCPR